MKKVESKKVLIVGAGPVGLAAAVFLSHKGLSPKIVDKLPEASIHSKALAINPRTLEIFDKYGLVYDFIKNSFKLAAVNVYRKTKLIIKNTLDSVPHKFPFITVQTQSESEKALTDILAKQGFKIERGITVNKTTNIENQVKCELQDSNGKIYSEMFDYVFCADGAHSVIRKSFGLKFDGSTYDEAWYLFDAKLKTKLAANEIHVFFFTNQFLFMLRTESDIWRIFGTKSDILDNLPFESHVENVIWRTNFTISHRVIERFNVGNVFFGGDAAHVHSPAGGRGMNLGIEDAYVFTELLALDRLDQYNDMRMKAVKKTVNQVHRFTNVARGKTIFNRLFRTVLLYILPFVYPILKKRLTSFFFGIDHELTI